MSPASRLLLDACLRWDRGRILKLRRRRDCSAYLERLARAEVSLDLPQDTWSTDVRELYQQLLETHGEIVMGLPQFRETIGFGRQRLTSPFQPSDFEGLRTVAEEIGVLPALLHGGSMIWRRL